MHRSAIQINKAGLVVALSLIYLITGCIGDIKRLNIVVPNGFTGLISLKADLRGIEVEGSPVEITVPQSGVVLIYDLSNLEVPYELDVRYRSGTEIPTKPQGDRDYTGLACWILPRWTSKEVDMFRYFVGDREELESFLSSDGLKGHLKKENP